MKIQSNNLLAGTTKSIQVVNGCMIAKEGPNMVTKMGLGGLDIQYDSVLTTRQTLKVNGKDSPIMYSMLGTNITFIAIIPTYGATNPQAGCSGSTAYLEYYYEDQPLIRRIFTDILVLSGDADHRIPQIYLYNPTTSIVTLDIMIGNLDENEISTSIVPTYSELKGLSFSSIQTDQIFGLTTGSTQFEIMDINENIQMVIPYNRIDFISIQNELLTITTRSDDPIKLYFLSEFNALQAISRMNWCMESSINRYATSTYPGLDTTAPTITFKPHSSTEIMNYVNGSVTKEALKFRFIDSVIDYDNANILRDGIINISNVDVLIINSNTGEQVTGITYDGKYSVTFYIKDLCSNSTSYTKSIVVDSVAPNIVYTTGITLNNMSLSGATIPGTISKDDLRRYYLNYVWDDVDGVIPNSSVAISIEYNTLSEITVTGQTYLEFSVFDSSLNLTSGSTTLSVVD